MTISELVDSLVDGTLLEDKSENEEMVGRGIDFHKAAQKAMTPRPSSESTRAATSSEEAINGTGSHLRAALHHLTAAQKAEKLVDQGELRAEDSLAPFHREMHRLHSELDPTDDVKFRI